MCITKALSFSVQHFALASRMTLGACLLGLLGLLSMTAHAQDSASGNTLALNQGGDVAVTVAEPVEIAEPSLRPAGVSSEPALDQQVEELKQQVLALNRDLYILEEELLFPANTQLAVFLSMDVGTFFALDAVHLKIDGKEVAAYLYTDRESHALFRGGVQRLFMGNLPAGEHELVAFFTGKGPHGRDYRRGATLVFEKSLGPKYIELKVDDQARKLQPEFSVKEWD